MKSLPITSASIIFLSLVSWSYGDGNASTVNKVLPVMRLDKDVIVVGAINHILSKAIEKRGTTFSAYRDGTGARGNFVTLLKVYGRAGLRCKKCRQAVIKKTKVNGRGTAYCPVCQPR